MEILVHFKGQIPVLTLTGRFDADGAQAFDEKAAGARTTAPWWVLDMTAVSYLSSIGLRSLVMLEKTLRGRSGGIMLAGTPPLVAQVLRVAKLDGWIRGAVTVDEALASARAATVSGPGVEHRVGALRVRTRTLAGERSAIEWWDASASPRTATPGLIATNLAEIGFAVGRGGFGASIDDAAGAVGAFVSTPLFAGVLPDGPRRLSDFVAGGIGDKVPVHVSTAIGITGDPSLVADVASSAPFDVATLVDAVFDAVAAVRERPPAVLGFVVVGSEAGHATGMLATAVAFDPQRLSTELAAGGSSGADAASRLAAWTGQAPLPSGRSVVGGAVVLAPVEHGAPGAAAVAQQSSGVAASGAAAVNADLIDVVRSRAHLDALRDVVTIEEAGTISSASVWVFEPEAIRNGTGKQLQVTVDEGVEWQPEWDAIVRHLYADCRSVTLSPLHGGYMSKTFRAVGYDAEGRRTLPTVLKIGSTELTAREERANREYVARFILNNGTTVLGGAQEGSWAGLRYNFLGVNGPDSRLSWLREHYLTRPTADVLRLYETLFTQVLKPWYGQPKWEQVLLYRDHTPLRLFPRLVETAEAVIGVSADEPTFDCHELGIELPNPYWFLKHEYPARAAQSRLWYTTVCHGDLNMQNVLVDERENLYVIDFSETRPRSAVSDFARVEPIVKFELLPLESDEDLRRLLEFEAGLTGVRRLSEMPPYRYPGGSDAAGSVEVEKAHALITLLRRCADTVTLFEEDMVPYWLALLEWTYSPVCYVQLSPRRKRYAACSAALICRAILEQERGARV